MTLEEAIAVLCYLEAYGPDAMRWETQKHAEDLVRLRAKTAITRFEADLKESSKQ